MQSAKICRACLIENYIYFNIYETLFHFNTIQIYDKEIRVVEIYKRFMGTSLNENDGNVPTNLCLTCLEKLSNAYEFLELCKNSEKLLLTYKEAVVNENSSKVEAIECISDNGSFNEYEATNMKTIPIPSSDNISFKSNDCETQYECIQCNEILSSAVQLGKHEKIHEGQWKCSECDKILAHKYSLRHHMLLHTGKPHECKVCRKRFAVISELNRHSKIYHKNGKSYMCNQCPKRFFLKSHLKSHELMHIKRKLIKWDVVDNHLINTGYFQCEEKLVQASVLKNEPDPLILNNFSADETCVKDSSQREVEYIPLNQNISLNTNTNEEESIANNESDIKKETHKIDANIEFYRCRTCFKKFRHKKNYLSHMRQELNCKNDLNTKNSPQKCEYCAIISDNVTQLRKHLETHLDMDPFKCKECGKIYKTWAILKMHTRQTHLASTKYHICTLCGRKFFTAKLLDEHYLVHQGIQKYKCDKCESSFCTLYGLRQHKTIHTRNALECGECGKILANKMSLKSHLTLHFGKKYQCTNCEKYFPSRGSLNRHMKCHQNERNYICDRCSKRYMFQAHLNEHIKKIHDNPIMIKCGECSNEFPHQRALKKHQRLKHLEMTLLICDVCKKSFVSQSRLKQHKIRAHKIATVRTEDVPE